MLLARNFSKGNIGMGRQESDNSAAWRGNIKQTRRLPSAAHGYERMERTDHGIKKTPVRPGP